MSNIRIVARWHCGTDIRTVDVVSDHALSVLARHMPSAPNRTISRLLGRPNDAHAAEFVCWSWWTICQTWEHDTRTASQILASSQRHDVRMESGHFSVAAYRCWYGCMCGAFPTGANYDQGSLKGD